MGVLTINRKKTVTVREKWCGPGAGGRLQWSQDRLVGRGVGGSHQPNYLKYCMGFRLTIAQLGHTQASGGSFLMAQIRQDHSQVTHERYSATNLKLVALTTF
jgi:hypothetical protein